METQLQTQIIGTPKYREWFGLLPDYLVYEIQNSGFMLHHLIGKYNGYLDEEMTIPSLTTHLGLEVGSEINIFNVYQDIIKCLNQQTTDSLSK